MSIRITERSFYPHIVSSLEDVASKYGVKLVGVSEVQAPGRSFPDILLVIDGHRILVQVKIGVLEKLIEDIVKTYPQARSLGADLMGILLPEEVRQIRPEELRKVFPQITITRGLILTSWQGQELENVPLSSLLESVIRAYVEYKRTRTPLIDYLTIAKVTRETIEELAATLRKYVGVEKYGNIVSAIIGRFDYYRAMLEDFLSKEEIDIYTADITAYLLVLQLLFIHVISKRIYKVAVMPRIENPLAPPGDLVQQLTEAVESAGIIKQYYKILGALPIILRTIQEISQNDPRVNLTLAKYIYTLHTLRPEDVKEELFGRIYQLGLPPETRKNLGAFFTKPEAAKLLASLAIERWDEKVLDPACGSGTLLAESYQAKIKRAAKQALKGLEKVLIEEHLVGIDIMEFARELTTINLVLQNPFIKVDPKVFAGDGIEKMVFAKGDIDPPIQIPIYDYLEELKEEYEKLVLPREGFDVVIMNPPFTRRERIPRKERERLDGLLSNIVKGKVGYSMYFFTAADNVIKLGGRLATVTPEEFFVGESAESVRRYLFLGEVYDERSRKYVRNLCRVYRLKYIIKSRVEVAFSEGARYRDYLVVFEKVQNLDEDDTTIIVTLKKGLKELSGREEEVVEQLKRFEIGPENCISTELFDARKVRGSRSFIVNYIDNLKPLVGLIDMRAQELADELLRSLSRNPTLNDLEERGKLSIRLYRPGQCKGGAEEIVQRLIIARYGERSPYLTFKFMRQEGDKIKALFKPRRNSVDIEISCLIRSLWTHAGVEHMDVTSEEEYAIVKLPTTLSEKYLKLICKEERVKDACLDLEEAYETFASNLLLSRRVRVTSRNTYWMAFYTKERTLGTQLPSVIIYDSSVVDPRLLTLYLNSTVTLIQLLTFTAEVEGAWLSLDHRRVWSHVRIPEFDVLRGDIKSDALKLFEEIGKARVKPLYERIKTKDGIQRRIDEAALKLLGLEEWTNRLDELYDSISEELYARQKILEEKSEKSGIKRRGGETKGKMEKQTKIDMYF